MGCAASSTVNTADDTKLLKEVGDSGMIQSPKIITDSGDLRNNEILNYGDQLESNKDVREESSNFHNSPAIMASESKSVNSSSKSVSGENKRSESLPLGHVASKYDDNRMSSPATIKSKNEHSDNPSSSSSPISSGRHGKHSSKASSSNKIGDVKFSKEMNCQEDISERNVNLEKIYKLISPQESILSSHHSNVVYKPTSSSDEEIKGSHGHSTNLNESNEEHIHANNSRSVMSEGKPVENKADEYWNQQPKVISNANSLNNIEFEKSSRNSRFSHTFTGSNHSPFFDSLNHGNTNYDIEENQNHDEVTEPINEKIILGTGDSEHWVDANQNYSSDVQNVSSIKSNNPEKDEIQRTKSQLMNLSATGDKRLDRQEQSNEDSTLNIDSTHREDDIVGGLKRSPDSQLSDIVGNCDQASESPIQTQEESKPKRLYHQEQSNEGSTLHIINPHREADIVESHEQSPGSQLSDIPGNSYQASMSPIQGPYQPTPKRLDHQEQSNEHSTLHIDSPNREADIIDSHKRSPNNQLSNIPGNGDQTSVSPVRTPNQSKPSEVKKELLKTAIVNESKCEGMLIGITSSPTNFECGQTREQYTIMETEEAINSKDMNSEI